MNLAVPVSAPHRANRRWRRAHRKIASAHARHRCTQNGINTLADSSGATFDASDRKQTGVDAGGNVTQYQYDPAGNLILITSPDNTTLGFDYDPESWPRLFGQEMRLDKWSLAFLMPRVFPAAGC